MALRSPYQQQLLQLAEDKSSLYQLMSFKQMQNELTTYCNDLVSHRSDMHDVY
jgi:hypothetical protein